MKTLPLSTLVVLCGLALLPLAACSKNDGPPPALSLQELPGALQTAFAKTKPDTRGPLDAVLSALQTNGYPQAFEAMQALSAVPGLTKKQSQVTAAGLIIINSALQEAQSRGDQQAAQTLQSYRRNK